MGASYLGPGAQPGQGLYQFDDGSTVELDPGALPPDLSPFFPVPTFNTGALRQPFPQAPPSQPPQQPPVFQAPQLGVPELEAPAPVKVAPQFELPPPQPVPRTGDQLADAQLGSYQREGQLTELGQQLRSEGTGYVEAQRQRDIQAGQSDRDVMNKRVRDEMAAIQKDNEDLRAANIDPGRLFRGGDGVARQIAAGVGMFLSGYINPRGPNPAMEIINNAIDRDIRAQEADLANRRAGNQQRLSLLQINMQKWGDEATAKAATRMQMLESVGKTIDANIASVESPIAKEKLLQGSLGVAQKVQEAMQAFGIQRQQLAQGWARIQLDRQQLADAKKARDAAAEAKAAEAASRPDPLGIFGINDADGQPLRAATEKEAADIRQQVGVSKSVLDSINAVGKLYQGGHTDWADLGSEAKAQVEAFVQFMRPQINVLLEQGAMGKDEKEGWREALGSPEAFWKNTNNIARLNATRESLTNYLNNRLSAATGKNVRYEHVGFQSATEIEAARRAAAGKKAPSPPAGPPTLSQKTGTFGPLGGVLDTAESVVKSAPKDFGKYGHGPK